MWATTVSGRCPNTTPTRSPRSTPIFTRPLASWLAASARRA
ncbi:Uncharacterised protein [Bordetella pertussis]|nr:Uncharacterised protein [Bordetella pertussis]